MSELPMRVRQSTPFPNIVSLAAGYDAAVALSAWNLTQMTPGFKEFTRQHVKSGCPERSRVVCSP